MRFKILFWVLFSVLLFGSSAFASIGKFSALNGEVSIIQNGKTSKATMQSQIDKSDAIKTGKDGKAQIVFKDNTVVTLGINSDFAIEEYFQDAKAPKVQFSVGKGTFKALTGAMGKINPEGFKLKTKTATIGIRGTGILGQTGGNEEKIACTQGGISVTTEQGTVNVDKGQVTSFAPGQPPSAPRAFTPDEEQSMEEGSGMNEMPSDTETQKQEGGIGAEAVATTGDDEGISGFTEEPEFTGLNANLEVASDILSSVQNEIDIIKDEVNEVDNAINENNKEDITEEIEQEVEQEIEQEIDTHKLPDVTSSYTADVSGSIVDDGVSYALEAENSYLVLGFDIDNQNLYGVLNLAYTDADGIYKVWTVNILEDDGTLSPEFTALAGGLSGSIFGTTSEGVDGSFDVTEDGRTATGIFGGTRDATLGLQLYKGISATSSYLNSRDGATPDGLYTETKYGSSGFSDDYFSLKVPNGYYFSGDHEVALMNSYGGALGESEQANIARFITRTPETSYAGGVVESWTQSSNLVELLATDSMMEYFVYFSQDTSNNFLTKDSVVAMGIETLPSQLPTDGIYAYSTPDMDAIYSDDMTLQLDDEVGYVNWKNRNMLHSRYDSKTGNTEIIIGKVLSDGSVSLDGKRYEFTTDSGIFTSGSTLSAAIFGSQQQGIVMLSEMTGASGTTELDIVPTFRDLSDSRVSSATESGTEALMGFASALFNYGEYSSASCMDVSLVLGKDADATPVTGSISSDSGSFSLGSTEGLSAYIDDGQFASVALSGGIYGYSINDEEHGYLLAVDDNEYFSWGYWAQKDMENEYDESMQILPSTWIAGNQDMMVSAQTYISDIIGDTVADVQYTGELIGNYINNGMMSALDNASNFTINVNFGSGAMDGALNMIHSGGTWSAAFKGSDVANQFVNNGYFQTNTFTSGGSGDVKGAFYGDQAQAVGGAFSVENGAEQAAGIFKGRK